MYDVGGEVSAARFNSVTSLFCLLNLRLEVLLRTKCLASIISRKHSMLLEDEMERRLKKIAVLHYA